MKALLLIALVPVAARAQLTLYAVNGTTQISVGSTYQIGQVPLNTTFNVEFQVYDTGTTPVSVAVTTLAGVTAFSQMSASYLEVRAGGVDYALRIQEGREALFQLPGVQP